MRNKDLKSLIEAYSVITENTGLDRLSVYKTLKDKIDTLNYMVKHIDNFVEDHREVYNDGSYDEPHIDKILAKILANMDHITDYLSHVYQDIDALKTNFRNRIIQNRSRKPNI
jgi:DNA-binding phage protein